MINFILILIAIILSPIIIACSFISLTLIIAICTIIASVIADNVRKLIKIISK